jgi:hypothetical protein
MLIKSAMLFLRDSARDGLRDVSASLTLLHRSVRFVIPREAGASLTCKLQTTSTAHNSGEIQ